MYIIDFTHLPGDETYRCLASLMDNYKLFKLGIGFKYDIKAILNRLGRKEMVF